MKGLELSKLLFHGHCKPFLEKHFPDLVPRIAVGLVGEGSECLEFDDEISRDHDWGASLCLWLNTDDFASQGKQLNEALKTFPKNINGYPVRIYDDEGTGRTGVLESSAFYYRHIGRKKPPQTVMDWWCLPEERLAIVTNGVIFTDPLGDFSQFRETLLAFYPEDVRRKKLAARLAKMAQSAQYNYPRSLAREEYGAAWLAAAEFIQASASAIHLLNRKYAPFYKWLHRSLMKLPILGVEAHKLISVIVNPFSGQLNHCKNSYDAMQIICSLIANELREEGLCTTRSDFLLDYGVEIKNSITEKNLRELDLFLG